MITSTLVSRAQNRQTAALLPWCLLKPRVSPEKLKSILDYVRMLPCPQTYQCFANSDLPGRADIVMNLYCQIYGRTDQSCFFGGEGMVVMTNPISRACI
ncbi:unnamed protein product [Eruca vesicaria subsp. sativa]|uniref:X8 domain-containing protein n=1 Tax=Eruca vesicaria subsp. sativa TaxID=29727 RepID=A0ABC8KCR6_ERUVS|nr:unnamed protein product [Eruca vesicaria subsp. sativa]